MWQGAFEGHSWQIGRTIHREPLLCAGEGPTSPDLETLCRMCTVSLWTRCIVPPDSKEALINS